MASRIPFSLPEARYQAHAAELDAATAAVFRSGTFILGGQVASLEKEFAAFLGAAHCLGVGSGTDAIEIALRACGIGSGAAVLTVAHTATATVAAIERAGAIPVLVDIDPLTFTMDPAHLETTIREYRKNSRASKRPPLKAVVPVHLYGHPADLPAILRLARTHGLRVIEDCAQAHGAELAGRPVGTWGDLAAFSFYPTKNLGAFGDGGAVVTGQSRLADQVRALREYGWKKRHVSVRPGVNSRLDELQAGLLRVLLRHLPAENARRRQHAEIYAQELGGLGLMLPHVASEVVHAFHQYVVRSPRRERWQKKLAALGIVTQVHYPVPVHRQPAYRGRLFVSRTGLPVTEAAARQVLSLPMSPHLQPRHVAAVCEAIRASITSSRTSS